MPKFHLCNSIKTAAAVWMLLLAGCGAPTAEPEAQTVAPVQVAVVKRASIHRIVKAQGILYAHNQASVTPKISAPISEFYVNRGSHVHKGQLLAVLENRDLTAAVVDAKGQLDQSEAAFHSITAGTLPQELTKAQAEVQAAKEALGAAQKVLESRKSLLDQGAIPRRQVDEANVAYIQARGAYDVAAKHLSSLEQVGRESDTRQAQAQLEAARGRHQGAQAQLEYSKIYSPIDGVVAERPLYAGEMSSAGTPLLTVMDVSRVVARANVPAEQIKYLKVGNPATITSVDASGELNGKVSVVSPALNPNSTTAEVWVEALNTGESMKPGSSVHVSIMSQTVEDATVIPQAAILPSETITAMVMVVGTDSLAHQRAIEAGIREGDRVQVLKGLDPGELVIVVGGFGLEDKTMVKVEKSENKSDEKTGEKADEKTKKKTEKQ
jgi:RND family efflux transporter MFP subunit